MLITVYKCLHGAAPSNLRSYLEECDAAGSYNLTGYAKLKVRAVKTTSFGEHSFTYQAPYVWNNFPNEVRRADTLPVSKQKVKQFTSF